MGYKSGAFAISAANLRKVFRKPSPVSLSIKSVSCQVTQPLERLDT
jgi:hypothetical protein